MTNEEIIVADSWSITWEQFTNSINAIDGKFGEGYAKVHPELIGNLVLASALNHIARKKK